MKAKDLIAVFLVSALLVAVFAVILTPLAVRDFEAIREFWR